MRGNGHGRARLKRTWNGAERNANEADYSQICFEFVYTAERRRCFIFNAIAASRFGGRGEGGLLVRLRGRGRYDADIIAGLGRVSR